MTRTKGGPANRTALRRAALAAVCLSGVAVAIRRLRLTRYAIEGESMLPALRPGDFVVVSQRRRPLRYGDIVLATDPREPARALVKRIHLVEPGRNAAWLLGDNPAASTDSRHFGAVPAANLLGRVIWRYWPRPRRF